MTGLRYVPGDWLALVRPEHVVLLPGDTPGEDVARLWDESGGPATVESLLSSILGAANMQIGSLPSFAIVSREAAPHVVVRGAVVFSATGTEGPERASGEGVATWQERRFQPADAWHVSATGGPAAGDGWLPIGEGIVRADGLRCGSAEPRESGTTTAEAAPAAPAEPAPAPEATPDPEPIVAPASEQPSTLAAAHGHEPESEPEVTVASPESEPEVEPEPQPEPTRRPEAPEPEASVAAAPEHDHGREADSISLEQISLAGELLGRREDETGTDDVSAPVVRPSVEDADDADTILVSRPVSQAPPAVPSAPEPAPAQAESADEPGMIDSVPWRTSTRGAPDAPPVPPTPPSQPAPPVVPGSSDGALAADGDHDGHTVMRSNLPQTEAEPAPATAGEPDDALTLTSHNTTTAAGTAEFVLGRACAEGHANPPTSSSCTVCGAALTGDAHQVIRPALGRMIVADGGGQRESEHELTRSVVLGRQPSARGFTGDRQPRLMQVSSPSGDISRSHLQVRVDGWHVELVDLGATNGTVLIRPGQAPRRLGKSESVLLLSGDVADLGDGVSLRFEDLP
ncbi:FHA domain-containing protein [Zhihengliuella halotolerans]|uniref:FHA domain-containing protein n=1 Tax=Zhihengliuella halotolerans TaxID=370736 RepID=UPI000C8012D9|nr:FHA domain-containing protein [Zhihengliuella halotolerans]